jgi:hypothetical protein
VSASPVAGLGYTPIAGETPPLAVAETPTGVLSLSSTADGVPKSRTFIGTAEVNAATAKLRLLQIAEEIISVLASDAQGTVKVTVEINADFPAGVADPIKRAVSENATQLGFKNNAWE